MTERQVVDRKTTSREVEISTGVSLERAFFESEFVRLHRTVPPEAERCEPATDVLKAELERLKVENAGLRDALAAESSGLRQRYEAELARLRSLAGQAREVPMLRRRAIYHAEQSKRAVDAHGATLRRVAELEAEQARLLATIGEYERVKREWFEPQLDFRAARIAELESANERSIAAWLRRLLRLGRSKGA